jgi:hypothetical protein
MKEALAPLESTQQTTNIESMKMLSIFGLKAPSSFFVLLKILRFSWYKYHS